MQSPIDLGQKSVAVLGRRAGRDQEKHASNMNSLFIIDDSSNMTQGVDRVHAGGLPGRLQTREHRDDHDHDRGQDDVRQLHDGIENEPGLSPKGERQLGLLQHQDDQNAQDRADHSAHQAEQESLRDEQLKDAAAAGYRWRRWCRSPGSARRPP